MRALHREIALATAFCFLLTPFPLLAAHHEDEEDARSEPAPESEGRKPWNQEAMTSLSEKLAAQMREVRRTFRKEPTFRDPQNVNRRAAHQMEQTLRSLETSTRQLRNRVRNGGGFEDTQGQARRIGMLLNDADVEGRRLMTSTWMAQSVQPAMVLINEIAPYYGSGPLFDPDSMQRVDRPPNPERSSAPQ